MTQTTAITTREVQELEELEEKIEAAREEFGAAAVAFEEARHRRDAALKHHRHLLEKIARLPRP